MPQDKSITLNFELDKETKTTIRFSEEGERASQIMGKAYIKTAWLESVGSPKKVRITIEAVK